MGHTHAAAGIAVGLIVLPRITPAGVVPMAAAIAATAGAALWPDMDQPQSSVAHTFYMPGRELARFIETVSGGHRHATHSLLAALAAGVGTYLASSTATGWQLLLFLLLAPAVHTLAGKFGFLALPVAIIAAYSLGPQMPMPLLTAAVTFGVLTHIAGDLLTAGGVPLFWPAPYRISVPIVGTTGGIGEQLIALPAVLLAAAWGLAQIIPIYWKT